MAVSAPHANGRQLLLQADRQFAIFSPVLLVFVVRSLVRYAASKESIPHNKRKNIYIYPLANMLTLGSWAVFFFFSFLSSVSTSSQSYIRKCMQHTSTHNTCANAAHTNSAYANGQLAMLSNVADWNYWKIIRKKKFTIANENSSAVIQNSHPYHTFIHMIDEYIYNIHAYTRLECLLHTDSGTTLYS